jgi:hypothetical protein
MGGFAGMLIFGLGLHCNPERVVDELVPFIAEDKGLRKGRDEKSSLDKLSWLSIRREYAVTNDWLVLLSYYLEKDPRGKSGKDVAREKRDFLARMRESENDMPVGLV